MTKPKEDVREWEKGLEKLLDKYCVSDDVGCGSVSYEDVKSFIRSLLSRQREELAGKIEGMKFVDMPPEKYGHFYSGYNQALSDVIKLIKETS